MVTNVKDEVIYVLGHADEERQRLIDQGEMFRAQTDGLFRSAGLKQGMRVLDVGCGVGDVSMLAAAFVGPQGSVVGVDSDPRSLNLAGERATDEGLDNVSFTEGDVCSISFDQPFDALVGRFILMFLPDPGAALRHLSALVLPGGVVAFQEYVMKHKVMAAPEPVSLWEQAIDHVVRTFEIAGVELEMGLKLGQVFTAAGLPAPQVHMDVHFLGPSDVLGPKVAAHTLRSIRPLAERFGVASAEEIDIDSLAERLQAELIAKNAITSWPPIVSAWTHV